MNCFSRGYAEVSMKLENVYFINGTAYAGKSTMLKMLAKKYNGILCEENYHDTKLSELDSEEFPALTYTRDLKDWRDFIRRTPDESVNRFFERPDREKQFLYKLLLNEENPSKAMENFRECLKRVNSREIYNDFLNSGFHVILRDDNRTIEDTLLLVEKAFNLK